MLNDLAATRPELNRPLEASELQRLALSVFRQRLTMKQASERLRNIPLRSRNLVAMTLRLMDVGEPRQGSIEEVVRFCEAHSQTWNVQRIRQDEGAQREYLDLIEETFWPLKSSFAAFWLVNQFVIHAAKTGKAGALPLFVVDGPSGIGKSTIVKLMDGEIGALGLTMVHLPLDMFLKDPAWRARQKDRVLSGELSLDEFDDSLNFDFEQIKEMLARLQAIRAANFRQPVLVIPQAFDKQRGAYQRREVRLSRKSVIVIEGTFAHHDELGHLYGANAFRCRLNQRVVLTREQFLERRGTMAMKRQSREALFDNFLIKSWERYEGRTRNLLLGILNLTPSD